MQPRANVALARTFARKIVAHDVRVVDARDAVHAQRPSLVVRLVLEWRVIRWEKECGEASDQSRAWCKREAPRWACG